jgi:hypothetical protein
MFHSISAPSLDSLCHKDVFFLKSILSHHTHNENIQMGSNFGELSSVSNSFIFWYICAVFFDCIWAHGAFVCDI